jgi:hypothetical protein
MPDMKGAREARSDISLASQHMGSVAGPARTPGSYEAGKQASKQYVGPGRRDACAGGAACTSM